METQSIETKQIYNLTETPWYFGAYLNMARHNVFLISNELSLKLKLNSNLSSEEHIANSFITNKDFLNKNNPRLILSNLVRFLPVAKVFSSDLLRKNVKKDILLEGVDISGMTSFLKKSFKELNTLRNDYSHFYSRITQDKRKTTVDAEFAGMLRKQFDFAVSMAKNRFEGIIPNSSFDFVEKKIALELFSDSTTITTRGLVFLCCLFLDKENAFQFFNKVSGFKDSRTYDFLATREVFTVFCVKLPHDKFVSDNPEQALQLDILNYLNRVPKELYNSLTEEGEKIFQPDLSEIVKNKIAENSINENIEEFDYNEYIQNISTKKRNEDRFSQFALKYLDWSESFEFDFHIYLGKIITKSYKKPLLGKQSDEENRTIEKNIKTFGKLIVFKKNSKEDNEEVINLIKQEKEFWKLFDEEIQKDFSQYAPHYHIEKNKIGILCYSNSIYKDKKYRPLPPDAFLSIHELPKVALLEILCKGKASELIGNFIQKNRNHILNKDFIEKIKSELNFEELQKVYFDEKQPFLVYDENTEKEIEDIKNKLNSSTDERQKRNLRSRLKSLFYTSYINEVAKRKTKLNNFLKDYELVANQIPSRIVDYWLNIASVKKETSIQNRIKAERKDCKQRIKALENGKAPKIGEMATYLARDIVSLIINEDVKKKITSFYYDMLQECLALFANPEKKQLFLDLCNKELKLFDKNSGHPFLANVDFQKISKTKDLYKEYIELKGLKSINKKDDNWIYNTFYSIHKNDKTGKNVTKISIPESNVPLSFLRLNKEKSDVETWLNSVTKGNNENPNPKPIDLPTNLFDDTLISLLKKKVKTDDNTKYNYSKLLGLWMKETQPFYNLEREYMIFKDRPYQTIVKFDPNENRAFKDYYSAQLEQTFKKRKKEDKRIQKHQVAAVFKKAIEENEKIIRFYQNKDRITLLMLNELIGKDLQIHLDEISPDSDKSPLEVSIPIKEFIQGKTITDTRKRKDFSVFRKLVSDKRLYNLFQYFDEETISYEILRKELNDYDRYKEQVFKTAFELEKAIINVASEQEYSEIEAEGTSNDKPNIQHKPYLNWLLKYNIINEDELEFMTNIRNKFSHNQYPENHIVCKQIVGFNNTSIAFSVVSAYVEIVNRIIRDQLK